ncbi:MAG: GT-D fold domain-containing glycosyltransferase [Muribaculaceae bacterium]|nr:GT-D fold domain-containing glycosyltransferase [Muribaculaceae bacterium]
MFNRKKRTKEPNRCEYIIPDNNVSIAPNTVPYVNLNITGKNNIIKIGDTVPNTSGRIDIFVFGDNNIIEICDGFSVSGKLNITIGNNHPNFAPVYDASIKIGTGTTFESCDIITYNSGVKITIGTQCMFAFNTLVYATDAHPIFDIESGEITNWVSAINIGNHCWIGNNATILKNVSLADNTIVGMHSVVTKSVSQSNSCVCGNPAKVVKNNIGWSSYGYEYCNNRHVVVPTVLSIQNTINHIIKTKCSLCRFGDGEFELMISTKGIPFQSYSESLSNKLKDVISSTNDNIMISINGELFDSMYGIRNQDWMKHYLYHNRHKILKFLNTNKTYGATDISCYYATHENANYALHYRQVRQIWDKRDIVIVCGSNIFDNFKFNIFDNAASIKTITAPAKDAFQSYTQIFKECCKESMDKLFLIILGPTATVLAYDLALQGYQALDIGHIQKDYNWYMSNKPMDINFFLPD